MSLTARAVGELGLIARMAARLGRAPSVRVSIGDDAAVLAGPGGARLLFASDMLVEGVHFTRRAVPARWIGWKALACNVSDIAAMGGVPRWAVVSLGLPPGTPVRFVEALYDGLARCARRFKMAVVGGDTVRAPQVVVDVAILGTVPPRRLTLRRGARVGDVLFVTGRLGGSLKSGRHARFVPRLDEAHALARRVKIRAMMDLSDGLAADLWQMSRASGVVLRVDATRIPVARAAACLPVRRHACGGAGGRRTCAWCRGERGRQGSVHHALMDGEDFELLFAVARRAASRVPRRIGACPITPIGSAIRPGVGVEIFERDWGIHPLRPRGFRHF